ncbi:MAG: amidohydrolase family protein, partial [Gammaproteobacteria bacterium]|nr:amidohydrolase family protein [Gammaproteobacteria bacterium]
HAIQSATSIPASHMGLESDVGALTAGRYADIVAVRGNPVDDITLLQHVSFVIKGGEVINRLSGPATRDALTD